MEMKERIFQIMKQEGLNQKDFAATTGISPATLSSIFNGRTSPTLNHAEALHRRFPKLSMSWLMFGEGDMYVKEESSEGTPSAKEHTAEGETLAADSSHVAASGDSNTLFPIGAEGGAGHIPVVREVVKYIDKPQRKITEVRIFFDDGTYETFPG